MMVEAGITVRRDDTHLAAAVSADQKAGKQMHRAVGHMQALHAAFQRVGRVRPEDRGDLLLPRTDGVPQFIVHDAQMWNLGPDPLTFRVDARHALAGGGILDEAQAVPNKHARIEFVIDDAGAARGMAANAGVAPCAAERAGNPFPVQIDGNGLRAFAGCKLAEDAADHFRLF